LLPIRYFVVAQAIFHFLDSGIQNELLVKGKTKVSDLSQKLNLRYIKLLGFLKYLNNEDYVNLSEENEVELTDKSYDLQTFKPWYDLLIGGYSETFNQISSVLKSEIEYTKRNSFYVGKGSCGISQHDALPMSLDLISKIPNKINYLIDIGCGDGSFLIDICLEKPDLNGIGIDTETRSIELGKKIAKEKKVSDRVTFTKRKANEIPNLSNLGNLCFITAFVLQEILEQSGREEILRFMKNIFKKHPSSSWIVIEVDNKFDEKNLFKEELALAYYNPYYLIHELTEQKLEKVNFWKELFTEAGLRILNSNTTDSVYDSLSLKVGFLLGK